MQGLSVIQIQVKGFDKNFSYLIVDEKTKEAALVDPCGEIERVFEEIEKQDLLLSAIFITHTHFDHHEKLEEAQKEHDVPVYMQARAYARAKARASSERLLKEKDEIRIGDSTIKTFFTPGHHDDCVCFYIPREEAADGIPKLITGDTLFVEGCGRTTSAGVKELYESLQFLKTFPDETEVFTGHDYGSTPVSTIGKEKQNNKYLLAKNFEAFKAIRLPQS